MSRRLTDLICICWMVTIMCAAQARQDDGVLPGIDVLIRGHTQLVRRLRLALLTNQTGKTADGRASIDVLHEHPDVHVQLLFSPEHGIRGNVAAGRQVDDTHDAKTGLPIISLYGRHGHRPPPEALARVDAVLYDIQDVGSRAYTYIWTMTEAMLAAAEQDKIFIVLDRPNPLGGVHVDGPITEDRWRSFLGLYPIPRCYGLTPGELARYLNREHGIGCRLVVIPMANYRRGMSWSQTGLAWTPPSPNIPSPESAVCFAATGTIGTLGSVHIGIGTAYPFQLVGATWLDAHRMCRELTALKLPGVSFEPRVFTPTAGLGKGQEVASVFLRVHSPAEFLPSRTEVAILAYLQRHHAAALHGSTEQENAFDKAMGTSAVRRALLAGRSAAQISRTWEAGLSAFRERIRPYLLYP